MNHVRTISSPEELIAFIPHTLGFNPESSMVCVPIGGGGPTARMDLPRTPEEKRQFLGVLSDTYLRRHPTERVVLVAYGEDGEQCVEALTALGNALVNSRLPGPRVGPVLWVNGDEWVDVVDGSRGTLDAESRAQFDFEFALMGRVKPTGSRANLAADLQGDPAPVSAELPAARERVGGMDAAAVATEVEWLGTRVDTFLLDRKSLADPEAARVLAVIGHPDARNAAETRVTRETALLHSEFWHDLVRRAPAEVRDTPAALLALSSYMDGRGAHAWAALDQIPGSHPLGDLMAVALDAAVHPRDLERALHSAAPGALMQQAALREAKAPGHRAPEQTGHGGPAAPGVDPDASAPGR